MREPHREPRRDRRDTRREPSADEQDRRYTKGVLKPVGREAKAACGSGEVTTWAKVWRREKPGASWHSEMVPLPPPPGGSDPYLKWKRSSSCPGRSGNSIRFLDTPRPEPDRSDGDDRNNDDEDEVDHRLPTRKYGRPSASQPAVIRFRSSILSHTDPNPTPGLEPSTGLLRALRGRLHHGPELERRAVPHIGR